MLELISKVLLVGGLVAFALRLGWFTFRKVTGGGDITNATSSIQSQTSAFIDAIIVTAENFVDSIRHRELSFFEQKEDEIEAAIGEQLVAVIEGQIRAYLDRLNAILAAEKLPRLKKKEAEKISKLLIGDKLDISVTFDENEETQIVFRPRGFISVLLFGLIGVLGFIGFKSREERLREEFVKELDNWLSELKQDRLLKIQTVSNRVLNKSRLKLMQDIGDFGKVFTAEELTRTTMNVDARAAPGSPAYRAALATAAVSLSCGGE